MLTKTQLAWLRAFELESPAEMGWLDEAKQPVMGPPETWVWLEARWARGARAIIHESEREGLRPYYNASVWGLTEAGYRLVEETSHV